MQLRKLAGLAMGALFVGSTLAAAATLGDFPAPFVQNGQVTGLVVVGAQAQPADVVAAINLAARLGSEAYTTETQTTTCSAGGDVSISGKGVALDTSGSRLYLGDAIDSVKQTLTGNDLPDVLGKQTFQDDSGTTYDYSEYLDLGSNTIQYLQPDTDMDPVYAIQMSTASTGPLYTLRAVFNKAINFTDSDVTGKTITLFGKEFTVSSDSTTSKLVLLGSSQEVTVNMGEEKTVEVGGTSYTIKVLGFDTTNDKVVLSVNGGAADEVKEGTSKKVNGLQIYAKLVTSWDNGNQGLATLQLGSEKYTFENGQEVAVGDNEDPIDGTLVTLTGNVDALTGLSVKVFAADSDHDLIKNGEAFTDPVFGTVKMKFAGMSEPSGAASRETIKLRNSGDYKGYVSFTDSLGNSKDVYFAYNESNAINLEDSSKNAIHVVEGASAQEDEYVFLAPTKSTGEQDTKFTHLVKVKRIYADADNNADDYVEFEDVMSGAVYKTQTVNAYSSTNTTSLTVDGKTYTVTFTTWDSSTPKKATAVSVEDSDGYTVVYPAIETKNGADLAFVAPLSNPGFTNTTDLSLPTGVHTTDLPNGTTSTFTTGSLTYSFTTSAAGAVTSFSVNGVTTPAVLLVEEEDNANTRNAVIVPTKSSSGKLEFDAPTMTDSGAYTAVSTSDSDKTRGVDVWGTEYLYDQSSTDHAVVDLSYPDNQVYFGVAALEADADASMGGATTGGTITTEHVNPVTADIAMLDTEAEQYKTTSDMILVGGTSVNSLVRELAESGKLSEAWSDGAWSLTSGEAIIKMVNDAWAQGHVALVVAGTNAADTTAAVKVLQQYDQHTSDLSGKEVVKVVNGVVTDVA